MLVRDLDGSWHGVKSMLPVEREGLAYNFEVGDFHTYFVGESDIWVHNCPELTDPGKIKFSQDSISSEFRDGRSVSDLAKGLKDGTIKPADVPANRQSSFICI